LKSKKTIILVLSSLSLCIFIGVLCFFHHTKHVVTQAAIFSPSEKVEKTLYKNTVLKSNDLEELDQLPKDEIRISQVLCWITKNSRKGKKKMWGFLYDDFDPLRDDILGPTLTIENIEIIKNRKIYKFPRESFSDLYHLNLSVFKSNDISFELFLSGGDAAGSWKCEYKIKGNKLYREIWPGEFPEFREKDEFIISSFNLKT